MAKAVITVCARCDKEIIFEAGSKDGKPAAVAELFKNEGSDLVYCSESCALEAKERGNGKED